MWPATLLAAIPEKIEQGVEDAVASGDTPGMAVVAMRHGKHWFSVADGFADPGDNIAMTPQTPLRIASITKTYVAAALLKQAAQRQLQLDTPISGLLPGDWVTELHEAGYDTGRITLDHLLTHSAGFPDHADSIWYKLSAFLWRQQTWTPFEQLQVMTGMDGPLFEPGTAYHYSDTGYVLLGEILANLSSAPLANSVRTQTRLDELGMEHTWWELLEPAPVAAPPRAHQYIYGFDVTDIHATTDLFGGGGLIASTADVARFFAALFDTSSPGGEVFQEPRLLAQMLAGDATPAGYSYRRGIDVWRRDGTLVYSHGGYWGTAVNHYPEHGITIAVAVTEQTGRDAMYGLLNSVITDLGRSGQESQENSSRAD